MRDQLGLIPFDQIFLLLPFGPQTPFYLHHNLCYFYNSLSSSYLMTFIFFFNKLHFYPCILYKFLVSQFSCIELNYEKFKLYEQNTLDTFKTTRVYFRVLHDLCIPNFWYCHSITIQSSTMAPQTCYPHFLCR